MKIVSLMLVMMVSSISFAQLDSVECKREIVQKGLSTAIESADLETLMNGAFEIVSLQYTEWSMEAYSVGITQTDSKTQEKTYYDVVVEPVPAKACSFTGRLAI